MKKDLYEIIGVDKNATKEEIKKQYRKKSMENHPDHGGDKDKFSEIALSYKILSKEESRKKYDDGENLFESNKTELEVIMPVLLDIIYSSQSLSFYNVLSSVENIIKQRKYQDCDLIILALNRYKEKLLEFNKRIKTKEENIIAELITNQINLIDSEILNLQKKSNDLDKALIYLKKYKYVTDPTGLPNLFNNTNYSV
jgi:curved DNA-binding protein CbpA